MGIYINPPNISKEEFLAQHCVEISRQQAEDWDFFGSSLVLLCYIENSQFSALAIIYNPHEGLCFTSPDPRPMSYFMTERENITSDKSGVSKEKLARYERF